MTPKPVEQVPATNWHTWVQSNQATVLDVREPAEWTLGTLPDAELIPLGSLPLQAATLDRSKPLLLVCRSGNRSNMAASFLAKAGFRTANLAGGMLALGPA